MNKLLKKIKKYAEIIFYSLGVIGLIDMAVQAHTGGELKIIRCVLTYFFEGEVWKTY